MNRYILRYRGQGAKPKEDVEMIRSLPETTIFDETSRMLLVEAPEEVLRTALKSLTNWVMTEERFIPMPDPPRPKTRHKTVDGNSES
ncbi:MAG: hypothetical protein L0226_08840 [Acidobacteria bacterium]|nr:hypothetical protein [Acidobacteriota bacterium]